MTLLGTVEAWVHRLAAAFRRRHGWICEELVPVRVETRQRNRWYP
jgi:hypothetical protein